MLLAKLRLYRTVLVITEHSILSHFAKLLHIDRYIRHGIKQTGSNSYIRYRELGGMYPIFIHI